MKRLVFGQTGQVAHALAQLTPEATFLSRAHADLSDPDACAAEIATRKPEAVINAAAYTAVDQAETDKGAAAVINGETPGAMARACAELDIPFVHISTDYVFSGRGDAPFLPSDATAPLGVYGQTKLAGEEAVQAAGGRFAILRTSWVFSAHGSNFLKTMLRLGRERQTLTIVADQIGGPTPADAIAAACLKMADDLVTSPQLSGVYHLSGVPDVSWADFAREIFRQADLAVEVDDIPTTAFPTPAKRPSNSRLECSTLQTAFGIARPDWRVATAKALDDLATK